MSLTPGARFGHFDVIAPLGAGAMGEVYRARDGRLNREVALKVLPEALTADPDRLARFTREAHVLASLNHPNVGAIHGLEESGGRQALVLELVEGPTLADRIAQGALPLDEALAIARQIAEALEAAHEQGIVHRDLKPANIKLRPDGTVKVLDFGLAKSVATVEAAVPGSSILATFAAPDVTASPTFTSPALATGAGVMLGTAAYMSPEQARGKPADRRADIWAFGCVLFEMLTGRRPFAGDEMADILAAILRAEPDWTLVPASTPRLVQRLLRRCLEKDPRQRLQSIGDARIELVDALQPADTGASPRAAKGIRVVPVAAGVVASAVVAAAVTWFVKPAPAAGPPAVTRSLLGVNPFDQRGSSAAASLRPNRTALALSPDGRTLVFRGVAVNVRPGGGTQSVLFVRALDNLTLTPLPATTGAESPFFSPDGEWIAYWDAGELRRVPLHGDSSTFTSITKVPDGDRVYGAAWGDDGQIVFATLGGLWRVPSAGGTPEQVAKVAATETSRGLPHILPGGRTVLFTVQQTAFRWDDARIVARSLSDGREKVVLDDAADARYAATGHLVFVRRGRLMAVPFDADRVELRGSPVAIVDDVMQAANAGNTQGDSGAGQFALSATGTLAYVTGGMQPIEPVELVWADRAGNVRPVGSPPGAYGSPRLSPDGQRILMFSGAAAGQDSMRVWLYDLGRRTLTGVTPRTERVLWAVWSPDGTRVAFERLDAGRGTVHTRTVDGVGTAEPLVEARPVFQTPSSWSRDGHLAFVENNPDTATDIRVVDVSGGDRAGVMAVQSPGEDSYPAFSPDGKWLSYVSDVSGRPEVYVQPFPGPGPRVLISTNGGAAPAWRGDGGELYYYLVNNGTLQMHAVPVSARGAAFTVGTPKVLFQGAFSTTGPARGYDVTLDGQRFLFMRQAPPPPAPPAQLVLVQNWFEELRKLK